MTNQPDLFTPQAHARRTDPAESHAAAASVSNIEKVRQAILDLLREYGPMHDEKIIEKYRLKMAKPSIPLCAVPASDSGIRSRRAELRDAGKIRKSIKWETTRAGRSCAVWEIAE